MRHISKILITIILGILPVTVIPADLATQRATFVRAYNAVEQGKYNLFQTLSAQLKNYPLYPYLIFADLTLRISENKAAENEINDFLQKYDNTLLAERLRAEWLTQLASQGRWPLFIKYYKTTDNTQLQCSHLRALLNTGQQQAAFKLMPKLWLSGATQPADCETAFVEWYKSGKLTAASIWERVSLAMEKNNFQLANQLSNWAPAAQKDQIKLWQKVAQNPSLVSQPNLFKPLTENTKDILIDGFTRWAKKKPQLLTQVWPKLAATYNFNEEQRQEVQKAIAMALVRSNDPNAAAWLATIKPQYADDYIREWCVRYALTKGDWQQTTSCLAKFPAEERTSPYWRYWHARSLAANGQEKAAQEIYRGLVNEVDYYGLMASKQLKANYKPSNDEVTISANEVNQVAQLPEIQRAYELYNLNWIADARREWAWAMDRMSTEQLRAAAKLAYQWHWYDRAIISAGKAKDWNDLTVRYPLAYEAEVRSAAKEAEISPAWVYAIMRQESNFIPDIKSGAGAVGLMQLLPNTARALAHLDVTEYDLIKSKTNIKLGSLYLAQLSDWFDGNIIIASAAYNVGPARLRKWLKSYGKESNDVWIEMLPWQETRNYVKAILLNMAIYQQKLKSK